MEQQQAPAAAGDVVDRLRGDEAQALERVLEQLSMRLCTAPVDQLQGDLPENIGRAARRMVLAAFRPAHGCAGAENQAPRSVSA